MPVIPVSQVIPDFTGLNHAVVQISLLCFFQLCHGTTNDNPSTDNLSRALNYGALKLTNIRYGWSFQPQQLCRVIYWIMKKSNICDVQFSLIWKCLAYHKPSLFPIQILSNALDQRLLKRERGGNLTGVGGWRVGYSRACGQFPKNIKLEN